MKLNFDWGNYAKLARQTVGEGCVLLRNEANALPLQKGETISIFGRIQFDYYKSGTGSGGMVNVPYTVSILDGLKACEELTINETLLQIYQDWVKLHPFDLGEGWAKEPWSQEEMPLDAAVVEEAAKKSDAAVIIIGRSSGEDNDNKAEKGSYLLTDGEEQMLAAVCGVFKRTIVLLNTGNIIDMKWVDTYQPGAVMYVWQGGVEGGNGVADVVTGKVNPSGKLSDTIALDINDYPSTAHFGSETENIYEEDIYVGYRYFETAAQNKVRYPFGYGMSYTTFSVKNQTFEALDHTVRLQVEVENTGNAAGKEVVQIYACPPQGKLGKPLRNLVAFEKTKLLLPGEKELLTFTVPERYYASYDDSGKTGHKSSYVLEAGSYVFYAGSDVRNAKAAGSYALNDLKVLEVSEEAMAPVKAYSRLVPVTDADGSIFMEKEDTPLRTVDLQLRIKSRQPAGTPCVGDKGWVFADVASGKVSMDDFLSQLSEEDLCCLTRGEGMCSPKVTPGVASAFGGLTKPLQAFGIPAAGCADGPSGIRMDCGTKAYGLPNGMLIASTFHKGLVESLFGMLGMELRKNGIDTLLGPGLNIHRSPLNGRNFEYFSEDPLLTGKMAVAELAGMHPYKVTGTIKHFACNNQEVQRHNANAVVSERALREIYLKGFELAVKEGHAYSIMTSYGPINGIWSASNYDMLTTILRNEWGFDGIVMTDWWAKMNEEGEEASTGNGVAMVRAQNDLYMVVADAASNSNGDNLAKGLSEGLLTRGELLRSAKNICNVLLRSQVTEKKVLLHEDEWTECNCFAQKEDAVVQRTGGIVRDMLSLDTKGVSTVKGSQVQYSLEIPAKGKYRLILQLKSDAGVLAQMPISVFMNNHHLGTITINGTEGKWLKKTMEFDIHNAIDNYLKLYFGESGVEIDGILIEKIS